MLGLPDAVTACLFDMDGVLTRTASVHAAAWKQMFDEFLRERDGDAFTPFDTEADYDEYVDGKRREDGTRSFLESRGIELPEGSPDDPAGAATINGLSSRKNELVLEKLRDDGVELYDGSVRYVRAAREAGLRTAFIARPDEHGPGRGESVASVPVDLSADSLGELVERLESGP